MREKCFFCYVTRLFDKVLIRPRGHIIVAFVEVALDTDKNPI